jgi:hypothetical protein
MGTSYATLTLRDHEGLEPCLNDWGFSLRRQQGFVVVEVNPDEEHVQHQARQLSSCAGQPVVAVLNQDDERLLLWVYVNGSQRHFYDSNPMHLACRVCSYAEFSEGAVGREAEEMARLLGVFEKAKALRSWLGRRRGLGFISERQRHAVIAGLLGLPEPFPTEARAG